MDDKTCRRVIMKGFQFIVRSLEIIINTCYDLQYSVSTGLSQTPFISSAFNGIILVILSEFSKILQRINKVVDKIMPQIVILESLLYFPYYGIGLWTFSFNDRYITIVPIKVESCLRLSEPFATVIETFVQMDGLIVNIEVYSPIMIVDIDCFASYQIPQRHSDLYII